MVETADPFNWVGNVVAGKYRVDAMVAEGGFGIVYRAFHLGFDEKVALKCLKVPRRLEGADRAKFLESFLAEGKLLHQLSRQTTGIVQALDVGAVESPSGAWTPYLVLEWLDGVTLDEDLAERAKRGALGRSLDEAIELLEPVARALGVAHERGVAHRDVKPANLFLANIAGRRVVKVVDFGIAKVLSDVSRMTRALEETGASLQAFTPQYGAPEQFHKRFGATGPWTDAFALALVLVELLTGKPALDGDTTQLFIAVSDPGQRPTPRAFGVPISDAVDAIFARALAVDPKARFRTAAEMWDALLAARASGQGAAPPSREAVATARTELAPASIAPTALATAPATAPSDRRPPPPSTASPEVISIPAGPPARRDGRSSTNGWWMAAGGLAVTVTGVVVWVASTRTARREVDVASVPSASKAIMAPTAPPPARARTIAGAKPSVFVPTGAFESGGSSGEYVAARFAQDDGHAFLDSARACLRRGLTLCTEAQWTKACDVDPALGEFESWVATPSSDFNHIITTGGSGCAARHTPDATARSAKRVGVCCERAVRIRGVDGDLANEASRRIGEYERAVDAHDPAALQAMAADDLRFFLLKNTTPARMRALWAEQFEKYPDLWVQHEWCSVEAQADGGWKADCRKLAQQGGEIGLVTSEYVWSEPSGKVRSILDSRVWRPFGPM